MLLICIVQKLILAFWTVFKVFKQSSRAAC
jgi:hypothetical protein